MKSALRLALVAGALALEGCVLLAPGPKVDFHPIDVPMSAEKKALIDRTEHYRRSESTSYMSFPEWYLVFNPQELAQTLQEKRPSAFPYFKSIGQFWGGYGQVYGLTRPYYPFDFGDHLMLNVIGSSTTVEYLIRGVYENSVGRATELLSFGARSEEEDYAAQAAKEYGDFIPTEPWFDFPFGHKLVGLWTKTPFFGWNFLRKTERKLILSTEYGFKSIYAAVIRLASHAVYGVADTRVYATARTIPANAFDDPDVKKIQDFDDGSTLITVPHYQGFTDTVPKLAALGVDFVEVAGNDEILLTIVAPADWQYDLSAGMELFSQDMLASPGEKRVAIQAPIASLGAMLREIQGKKLRIEHLYDY